MGSSIDILMYMLTIKGQFIINTEKEFYFDLLYCFMVYIRNGFALGIRKNR